MVKSFISKKFIEDNDKIQITDSINFENTTLHQNRTEQRFKTLNELNELESNQDNEFNLQSLVDTVQDYNKIYEVSITDKDLVEIRKDSISRLVSLNISFPNEDNQTIRLNNLKKYINNLHDKNSEDIRAIKRKIAKFSSTIKAEMSELIQLEGIFKAKWLISI